MLQPIDRVYLRRLGRLAPRSQPHLPGRQPLAQEERVQPRHHPSLPLRQVLQEPPADLQEAPDLLALHQRQAEGLPVPGLSAPLQRGHAVADAQRIRDPAPGQDGARLEQLKGDIQAATSPPQQAPRKGTDKLDKQQVELMTFDEKLRHYADKRIALDLDDGVKVNYGQFGDLLAEVKAIHGKKPVRFNQTNA